MQIPCTVLRTSSIVALVIPHFITISSQGKSKLLFFHIENDILTNMRIGKASQKLIMGFFLLIIIGASLLFLPISLKEGIRISPLDSLFISASALCVTGLTPVDVSATFTIFGRVVLASLIQLGGMGFAIIAVFLLILLRQNVTFSQRNLAREALNQETGRGIVSLVKFIIVITATAEIAGAVSLSIAFAADGMPVLKAIGMGAFHSISAFNNAGFDLFGNSLINYNDNIMVNLTISLLIIVGGIGFFVLGDIKRKHKWKKLAFHTKIVLTVTLCLIAIGGILLKTCDPNLSFMESFFLSVSARTAGFNSVDMTLLSTPATCIVILLMFIGASPGSTGGGIKTTTFFTIIVAIRHVISNREASAFNRRILKDSIIKAFSVMTLFLFSTLICIFGMAIVEKDNISFLNIIFEAVSAIGTVGLTRGVTPTLHPISKVMLISLMFIGRLGPLTVVSSLSHQQRNPFIHCVEERVIIG